MALAYGVRAHLWSRFHDRNRGCREKQSEDWERKVFTCLSGIVYPRSIHNNAQILQFKGRLGNPQKEPWSRQNARTILQSVKRGSVGNTRVLPRAKMLLVPMIFFPCGYIIYWVVCFDWVNVIFAACFILRGHDTHIDFLRLLFLVGMICPLMQEHFLWPLWRRQSLSSRLNKSFRLFNLPQSASWIWIAKDDIFCLWMWWFLQCFDLFCHPGPSSFSVFFVES